MCTSSFCVLSSLSTLTSSNSHFFFYLENPALRLVVMMLSFAVAFAIDRLLYYPNSPEDSAGTCDLPSQYGISRWEKVEVTTTDGVTVRGFYMKPNTVGDQSN